MSATSVRRLPLHTLRSLPSPFSRLSPCLLQCPQTFPPARRRPSSSAPRLATPPSHRTFSTTSPCSFADVQPDTTRFDPSTIDRESDSVSVVIVGGGPAGLASAIRLRQLAVEHDIADEDFRVVVLEKSAEIGGHILSGCVVEPGAIDELLPQWRDEWAKENATPATGDKMRFLTKNRAIPIPAPPQMHNHGNLIVSLSQLTRYLGEKAEELGVEVYPGFAASEVLYDPVDRSVRGVATNDLGLSRSGERKASFERGMEFRARVTLFAEGCHGSLTKQLVRKFDLRRDSEPQTYGLGIKEVWEVDPSVHEPGEITHSLGYPLPTDTYGGGWMYHYGSNLVSVGLVVGLDYPNPYLNPYMEFQKMKQHPLHSSVLRTPGAKCVAYGARALNEGGFQSIPKCAFPGGALVGDTAGFLNVPKIKGTHTAMRSGMLAAETSFKALREQDKETVFLYDYEDALRKSSIWTELKQVRNMRPSFHSPLGLYGGVAYSGLEAFLLKGRMPWTLSHGAPDHARTKPASECEKIVYEKPDGEVSFDLLTSVSRTGTNHEEDEPCHLVVNKGDWAGHGAKSWPKFKGVEGRFCPAGVYEYPDNAEENKGEGFRVNSQNCIHCKTCDIKVPDQDIDWVTPQGGEGPKYSMT